MSASKDKRIRKEQIAAGTDRRSNARAEEQKKQRKSTITYAIVGIVVVLFVAAVLFYNSAFMVRHTTAVTIDGQDYSAAQLNYYYSTSYMNFYSAYSNYITIFFQPDQSLADQTCSFDQSMSWRDYFLDTATHDMAQIQMLNDQAEAAGFTLSEEQQANYDVQMEELHTAWEDLGYSNLQQYLNLNFGKGVDEEMVRQEMYKASVAAAFSDYQHDSYEYSDQELDDYYAEHADELDVIDYAYYSMPAPTPEATEEPAETEDAEATEEPEPTDEPEAAGEDEEAAEDETEAEEVEEEEPVYTPSEDAVAIAEAVDGQDEDAFADYLDKEKDGAEPTHQTMPGSQLSETYSEWLLDAEREPGDAAAFATESTEYIVMFLGRDTNDYPAVNFRHVLIEAEDTDGDGAFSEEEIDAAKEEAESVYDEWKDGDATEDSFAEIANDHSDDTGSNTIGGLYEHVAKGDMVEPINDWIFDAARKAGDTTVVSYDGSNYTGTHVVYFVGDDDMSYAHYQADEALRHDDYDHWSEDLMASYEPTTAHLSMCGKNH